MASTRTVLRTAGTWTQRSRGGSPAPWPALVACGAAAAAAAWLSVMAPAPVIVGIVVAAFAVVVVVRRPIVGLAMLLALFGLVPRETLIEISVPLGGFELQLTDLLIALTMGAWIVRTWRRPDTQLPPRLLVMIVAAFLACALFGVLTAQGQGTTLNLSLLELRPLLYSLLIFPIVAELRDARARVRAVGFVVVVGVLASLITMVKYAASGGAHMAGDAVAGRVLGNAFLLPMLGILFGVVLLMTVGQRLGRVWLVGAIVVCVGGLVVTFQRGGWLAAAIALLTLFALIRPRPAPRAVPALCLSLAVLIAAAIGLQGRLGAEAGFAGLVVSRATQIDNTRDLSNQYRIAEWQRAVEVIRTEPLTGIGLGSSITFYSPLYDDRRKALGGTFTTFYIHNSYIWAALKMGIFGLLALVAFPVWGVLRGLRVARVGDRREAAIAAGCVAGLLAMLALAVSGPHLTIDLSAAYVAAMVGLAAAVPANRSRALTDT